MTLAQRGKGNGNCVGVIYKLPNITTDLSKPPYLIYSVSLSPKKKSNYWYFLCLNISAGFPLWREIIKSWVLPVS